MHTLSNSGSCMHGLDPGSIGVVENHLYLKSPILILGVHLGFLKIF
jgi:hypothetical protein